jgi:hypothetical protein
MPEAAVALIGMLAYFAIIVLIGIWIMRSTHGVWPWE